MSVASGTARRFAALCRMPEAAAEFDMENKKTMTVSREHYDSQNKDSVACRLTVLAKSQELGRPLRAFVRTFGCQQNENDSEKLRGILGDLGYLEADGYEDADLVLINTCSIRENADQRLFGHLGELKALKESRRKNLICGVCGCLPTQKEQAEKIRRSYAFVNLLFGPADIQKLPSLLLKVYAGQKRINAVSEENSICEGLPLKRERKYRGLVSIMYGCNNFCTYCVVPYTRGRERSREAASILQECQQLAGEGIPEVMLLGQNVNAWGFDLFPRKKEAGNLQGSPELTARIRDLSRGKIDEPQNFAELLAVLGGQSGLRRLRYMSPHPRDFDASMITALAEIPQIENHIHLPLQSGSDRILKAMNRHYDSARYRELVCAIREVRPDISLSTDIIVGFPGESNEDFEQTLELVEELRFESAFMFIYSPRPGTAAAKMEQVPPELQHERFDRLAALQAKLSLEAHTALVDSRREVLVEGVSHGDPQVLSGRDSEFHLINIHLNEEMKASLNHNREEGLLADYEGRFAEVLIRQAKTYSLEADLLRFL